MAAGTWVAGPFANVTDGEPGTKDEGSSVRGTGSWDQAVYGCRIYAR
jgi:hypothetical protein